MAHIPEGLPGIRGLFAFRLETAAPLCLASRSYEFDHPAFGVAKQPPGVRARLIQKLEAIPDLTGLTYDYSDILGLNRTE
ncbi:MAG: hypothetical protein ACRD2L_09025 [Terriglobia bacterium]